LEDEIGMNTSSHRGSTDEREGAPGIVTVRLGGFSAEALSAGSPRPERLDLIVDQAIRFYLRSTRGDAGWAFPKFLGVESGQGPELEVRLDRGPWEQLRAEAARQEVEPEDLLQHATMYFAAARDGGRLTSHILEVIEGDGAADSLGRRDDRRSA
jgi:hypothetical protein